MYFWLHWVFVAAGRLSLVAASRGYSLPQCSDFSLRRFSCCGAQAPGSQASMVAACGLRSCGPQAQLLCGMSDLLGPGTDPCLLNWQADSYPMHHQGSHFPLVSQSGSSCVLSGSVVSDSCDPMDCNLPGSSVHGDSPCKSTGVGCHFLLQEEVLSSL